MDRSATVNHDHLYQFMVNGQFRSCQLWSFISVHGQWTVPQLSIMIIYNSSWSMDSSAAVNYAQLYQFMVNGQFHNCQSWSFITVHGQWTVPQLSIMISYISSWSMDSSTTVNHDHLYQFMVKINSMDKGYGNIVRWQGDLVKTKGILLPVCDKPYCKVKENLPHWEELEHLWNYALLCISLDFKILPS